MFRIPFAKMFGVTPLKKFPAPVMEPMAPFFVAGAVIYYGVYKAQTAMESTDEWKNDPRNKSRQ
ncbi:uncharacterized protein PpBr36_09837 [Pyricularia pennisetigena]|uniref:uncharacterized protein n=1 Tax=Pyricularia pennisetigena TaxID=1578925 RepID=UPI0011519B12|nr:uncharacterized protein PpBr36_09837 [Pyricularia pennisetigena]TLS22319.1 hypothetical protein PpBr36_09837 [Pyricularia pennisetigena]